MAHLHTGLMLKTKKGEAKEKKAPKTKHGVKAANVCAEHMLNPLAREADVRAKHILNPLAREAKTQRQRICRPRRSLPEIPSAQYCLHLAPFDHSIPVNPFSTFDFPVQQQSSSTPHQVLSHLAELLRSSKSSKKAAVPEKIAVPKHVRMKQLGEALSVLPRVLIQHALGLGPSVISECDDPHLSTLAAGYYPPRRAHLSREYNDPTGVIRLKGSRAITLSEPGMYHIAYRDSVLLLDPNDFMSPELITDSFTIVAMALFAFSPTKCESDRSVTMIPHTLNFILPSNILTPETLNPIFDTMGNLGTFFNLFTYPSANVHFRTHSRNTRIALLTAAFSNRTLSTLGEENLLPPVFVDLNGVIHVSWLRH